MSNKKDIALFVAITTISAVFVLGMIYWPEMPKDDKVLKNLYYVTTASVLYMLSWIVLIMASNIWVKAASCLGVGVFSVNLYIELFLDPTHWTKWNWWLVVFVSVNMFLSVLIVEYLKRNKDGRNRNNN